MHNLDTPLNDRVMLDLHRTRSVCTKLDLLGFYSSMYVLRTVFPVIDILHWLHVHDELLATISPSGKKELLVKIAYRLDEL